VGGYDVTDAEFLPDPAKFFEDRERLFREGVRESFVWWRSKKLLRLDPTPWISDLAQHRWRRPPFNPDGEIDAVRQLQADRLAYEKLPLTHSVGTRLTTLQRKVLQVAYDKLLANFHGKVLQVAHGHMPKRWHRRMSFRDKHVNNLLFEDLVAAGVAAMWTDALQFDLNAGYRFWTGVRKRVLGEISDEARSWRRHGQGETRIERWLYAHPEATPEQVLLRQKQLGLTGERGIICHSLREAAEWIKQFQAWAPVKRDEPVATASFQAIYSCFDQYTLAPQLEIHDELTLVVDRAGGGGFDAGPDVGNASRPESPRDLRDFTEAARLRFKNGKRQVTRQKAASYCYGIQVTPELRAKAIEDLEFAQRRWECRTRRSAQKAREFPRWSTKWLNHGFVGQGTLGHAEDENKQIVPAYVPITRFKWKVEYRGTEGNILSVLESPSRYCLKSARGGSRPHNVPSQSILSAA
jgi:hypothetical protein